MPNLFVRNLGFTLVFTLVWLAIGLLAKRVGGMLLLGGFWVVLFSVVCWRIEVSFRNAIEAKGGHPYSVDQLSSRLTGLMLGVLLAQIVLFTLVVFYMEGGEMAKKALFIFLGIAGSTSLQIPVYMWHRPAKWSNSLVGLLLLLGLYIWWEVVRNQWPDELLLGPAIGLATFTLCGLLIRMALIRGSRRDKAEHSG